MSNVSRSIGPDERVLRRIFIGQGYFEAGKAPPVQRGAFTPNPRDMDGLSFYLAEAISPADLAAAAEKPASCYIVASLRAGDLYDLGLTLVVSEEASGLPGHVVAPEVNWESYVDPVRKRRIKEVQTKLAQIASENIVFSQSK